MIVRSIIAAAIVVLVSSPAVAAPAAHVSGFVMVSLNPQPEPPGKTAVTDSARIRSTIERVALNPQPEPPGVTDARMLPPGPCRSMIVSVAAEGVSAITSRAVPTAVRGKCAYDVVVPGARAGSMAKITFTRAR